jgi:hypothetical protein
MKLKYYMRGLGIGIILTTLILTIARPQEKMSDKEIMRRATELGMVLENEDNQNLDKVLDNIIPSEKPTPQPSSAPMTEPTVEPSVEPTATPSATPTKEPTPTIQPSAEVKEDQNNNDDAEITFVVKGGMSSRQVSILLAEYGIVDNADDFNQYIVKRGKTDVIRVGTYTLQKGATYKDIIEKITK